MISERPCDTQRYCAMGVQSSNPGLSENFSRSFSRFVWCASHLRLPTFIPLKFKLKSWLQSAVHNVYSLLSLLFPVLVCWCGRYWVIGLLGRALQPSSQTKLQDKPSAFTGSQLRSCKARVRPASQALRFHNSGTEEY